MPSVNPSSCEVCFGTSYITAKGQLLVEDQFARLATIRCINIQHLSGKKPLSNRGYSNYRYNWFRGLRGTLSLAGWNMKSLRSRRRTFQLRKTKICGLPDEFPWKRNWSCHSFASYGSHFRLCHLYAKMGYSNIEVTPHIWTGPLSLTSSCSGLHTQIWYREHKNDIPLFLRWNH